MKHECKIAIYSDKKKKSFLKYLVDTIPYCKTCSLGYVYQDDFNRLNEMSGHRLLTHTHVTCAENKLHNRIKKEPMNVQYIRQNVEFFSANHPVVGKWIHYSYPRSTYGDGIILGMNDGMLYINFISNRNNSDIQKRTTRLLLSPAYLEYYQKSNPDIVKLLTDLAEENQVKMDTPKISENESVKMVSKPVQSRIVDFSTGNEPFPIYLCEGHVGCIWQSHLLESVTANVLTFSDRYDHVNLMNVKYCVVCDKYFIHRKSFEQYTNTYGSLVVKPNFYRANLSSQYERNDVFANLNPKSLLKIYGYSAGWDTTDDSRQ